MTHPLDMNASLTGWDIDPELLEEVRIELHHWDYAGDALFVTVVFKSGRRARIMAKIKDGTAIDTYDDLQKEIATPTKPVIEHG